MLAETAAATAVLMLDFAVVISAVAEVMSDERLTWLSPWVECRATPCRRAARCRRRRFGWRGCGQSRRGGAAWRYRRATIPAERCTARPLANAPGRCASREGRRSE